MLLKCTHNLCKSCLDTKIKSDAKCGICKAAFGQKLEEIPVNQSLMEIINEFSGMELTKKRDEYNFVCSRHLEKEVDYYCKDFDLFMCHECAFDNNHFKKSKYIEKYNTNKIIETLDGIND